MRKLIVYISLSCLATLTTSFRRVPAGHERPFTGSRLLADSIQSIYTQASFLYEQIGLAEKGLSEAAFEYAYKGYEYLLKKNLISEGAYLTICDFSQSSKQKRFYLIDIVNNKILMNTYVAHGRNSGGEYATRFSNKPCSRESSLGFYITKNIYRGEHGLSLRVEGLEPGFNDRAYKRAIVIHGADYIGDGSTGRSYGCPAVPLKESKTIINTIKDGSCLFIYHPLKKYLQSSKILNS
ncbi:MAG: murein L,D-transpeptidase catalytic domain family protein [Bacteroidota bacterium]|nr:murein L,D-transpeptidase catalytic domain family protein [Bacteroidota bacterium]